jgi:hypothetical protein
VLLPLTHQVLDMQGLRNAVRALTLRSRSPAVPEPDRRVREPTASPLDDGSILLTCRFLPIRRVSDTWHDRRALWSLLLSLFALLRRSATSLSWAAELVGAPKIEGPKG